LEQKADVTQVNEALSRKANISDVNTVCFTAIICWLICIQALDFKADLDEVRRKAEQTQLEDVKKEVALRARVQDVMALVDQKASIDEVNNALMSVNKELDQRTPVSSISQIDIR